MGKDIMCNKYLNGELKKFIEDVVETNYAKFQSKSTAKVIVEKGKRIQIYFDSEVPYLGRYFWRLLDEISEELDGRLKQEGYIRKKDNIFYDFIIFNYSYETIS